MEDRFSLSCRHRVDAANYMSYEIPEYHPDRTMEVHDLIYILEGEWVIAQEDERFEAKRDDVVILRAGAHHYGVAPCSRGTKTMFLHICREPGDGTQEASVAVKNHINTTGKPEIRRLFEKIILAKSEKEEQKASVYFDALLYELEERSSEDEDRGLAGKIRNLILASSERIPGNSQIAERFHVSVKTAEHAFKKAFGMTIHQYALQTKIEQVKTYLVDFPDMKLFQIAKNLGFYDEYHLSRQFKRICGDSPSQYRKKMRNKEEQI